MCRLMIAEGAQPGKAWIYGRLVAQTRNNPRCSVAWGWHVAPTLPVGDPAVTFVIDPALFERPQPLDAWKQAVNGATATLAETDAPVYRTSAGVSTTDPNYILTENVLATDRPAAQAEISRGRRSAAFGQCPARLGMAHAVALGGSDHRLFVLTDGQRLGMSDGARWIDLRRPPGRQKYELRRRLRYAEQALRLCFDVGPRRAGRSSCVMARSWSAGFGRQCPSGPPTSTSGSTAGTTAARAGAGRISESRRSADGIQALVGVGDAFRLIVAPRRVSRSVRLDLDR
jgi:hypothetical protein